MLLLTIFTAATLVQVTNIPCLTGLPCMPLVPPMIYFPSSNCRNPFKTRPSHLISILTVAYKVLHNLRFHLPLSPPCLLLSLPYCFPAMWAFFAFLKCARHFSISGPLCFVSLLLRLLCHSYPSPPSGICWC